MTRSAENTKQHYVHTVSVRVGQQSCNCAKGPTELAPTRSCRFSCVAPSRSVGSMVVSLLTM